MFIEKKENRMKLLNYWMNYWRRLLENGFYMYWNTINLKDDIRSSKDDFYKWSLYYMEGAETKDDIAV